MCLGASVLIDKVRVKGLRPPLLNHLISSGLCEALPHWLGYRFLSGQNTAFVQLGRSPGLLARQHTNAPKASSLAQISAAISNRAVACQDHRPEACG